MRCKRIAPKLQSLTWRARPRLTQPIGFLIEFPRVCWAILAALTWRPEDRQKLAERWTKQ
jgi:hypothetical protein